MRHEHMPEHFMRESIKLSRDSVIQGGGPFAAIIVKQGTVIARGTNTVVLDNDPTAHAEINAIRQACRGLNTFDLSGCEIFCSCEPCPMCMGAIYWARIQRIYYGNTKRDAAAIGFDDAFIYDQLHTSLEKRKVSMVHLLPEEAGLAFRDWEHKADKTVY